MPTEVEELTAKAQAICDEALHRMTSRMPFLVRWRDRIVYSIVLAAGLGAVAALHSGQAAVAAFAAAAVVFFLLFNRYDRLGEQVPEFSGDERRELIRLRAAISKKLNPAEEPATSYWRPRRPTLAGRPCGWCASTEETWTGRYPPFSPGEATVEAACRGCLRKGRAALRVTEGELLTLRNSVAGREPDLSSADLDRRVRAAAEELRRTPAPPLAVDWPQCCADFCRFEGAWDAGDFALACGSFDAAVLAEFIEHACGRRVERTKQEMDVHADLLVSSASMWQVFRCRTCNRLFATPTDPADQS